MDMAYRMWARARRRLPALIRPGWPGPAQAARTEDSKYLAASFRGRGLAGTAVPVPKGYTGRIIREDHTVYVHHLLALS